MKIAALGLALASASIALASCASTGLAGGGGPAVGYNAYYDGSYGPLGNGFWGGGFRHHFGGAGLFRHGGMAGFNPGHGHHQGQDHGHGHSH